MVFIKYTHARGIYREVTVNGCYSTSLFNGVITGNISAPWVNFWRSRTGGLRALQPTRAIWTSAERKFNCSLTFPFWPTGFTRSPRYNSIRERDIYASFGYSYSSIFLSSLLSLLVTMYEVIDAPSHSDRSNTHTSICIHIPGQECVCV